MSALDAFTRGTVEKGRRYAAGVKVPLAAKFLPGSPLEELQQQATGGAIAAGEAGGWLAANGWSNALVYPAGQSPFTEPAGDHEYVIVATRSGDTGEVDVSDPAYFGAILWFADAYQDMAMPTPAEPGLPAPAPSSSTPSSPTPPAEPRELVGYVVFGGLALAGIGLLVWAMTTEDKDRRNPTHQPSYQQIARWKNARRKRHTRTGWGSKRARFR